MRRVLARQLYTSAVREEEAVVVGGGVVGLAVTRALSLAGRKVLLVEAEGALGTQTSSRNSEVLHAGLYYPQNSLKAQLCVSGKELLYDYCQHKGVPHRRLGKLLVAPSSAQAEALAALHRRAEAAGVKDLTPLTPQQARRLEPLVRAQGGALLSPSSGILSVRALMNALLADAEASGRMSLLAGG